MVRMPSAPARLARDPKSSAVLPAANAAARSPADHLQYKRRDRKRGDEFVAT
jgi:hypothetical protein